ncbi:hypothetical protein F0562_021750 [Nyssa sinensis]|uniref:Uncharacterized protein n=1 Tax=Nyssa sinensis TaxID=561372 RepID=A0A5J5BLT8_9ASTE|nr:hypothetical protein F0562_021750 [Nyssa sinensis]
MTWLPQFLCPVLGRTLSSIPFLRKKASQDGSLMITCMPSRNEVTQLTVTGEWSTPKIHEAMELCLDACSKLGKILRSCLKEAASAVAGIGSSSFIYS